MTVSRATAADLDELLSVEVLVTRRDRQTEILRESVRDGGCFVACEGRALAGFVTWDSGFFRRPFVRLLVVLPAFRRHGAGRALLVAVEAHVAAAGEGELFVSTETGNAAMRALLATLHYEPSGSIDNINAPGNAELVFYKRV